MIPFLLFFDIITLIIILQGGFMRFNQFSYLALPRNTILYELKKYGFDFPSDMADKKMLEAFLSRFFLLIKIVPILYPVWQLIKK